MSVKGVVAVRELLPDQSLLDSFDLFGDAFTDAFLGKDAWCYSTDMQGSL